jgi:hypothetical protein
MAWMRNRRRLAAAVGCGVVALVAAVGVVLWDPAPVEEPYEVSSELSATAVEEGWTSLSTSPLSARTGATAVWTGDEVLVVGGSRNLCPPNADCAMAEPLLTDGAAYSPLDGTWRTMSQAPAPVIGEPVVGDDAVYFRTVLADGATFVSSDVIARYRPSNGEWTTISAAEVAGASLVAMFDDHLVFEDSGWRLVLLDPDDGSTQVLPEPPLPDLHSAHVAVTDGRVYLFGNARVADADTSKPSLRLAAVYDSDRGWRRLPDSELLSGGEMVIAGGRLVDSSNGSADGGKVNNWGRTYAYGGMLDPARERWEPLPLDRPNGSWVLQRAVEARGGVITGDGLWLDPAGGTWSTIPAPSSSTRTGAATTWAGDRLFVWGGESWSDGTGVLHDHGATYQFPG